MSGEPGTRKPPPPERGLLPSLGPAARAAIRPRSSAPGAGRGGREGGRAGGAAAGQQAGAGRLVPRGSARPGPGPALARAVSARGRVWCPHAPSRTWSGCENGELVPAGPARHPRARPENARWELGGGSPRPACPPTFHDAHLPHAASVPQLGDPAG